MKPFVLCPQSLVCPYFAMIIWDGFEAWVMEVNATFNVI
jgi:hypothetical protein